MGLQFHQTCYGKDFFEFQLPNLIEAIDRVAEALEKKSPKVQLARCVDDGVFYGKLLFQKDRVYILVPADDGYYDVFDRETGEKVMCTRTDLEGHFNLQGTTMS